MKRFFYTGCFVLVNLLACFTAKPASYHNAAREALQKKDTIPDTFVVNGMLRLQNKTYPLKLQYRKQPEDASLSITVLREDALFPDSFYTMLDSYFEQAPVLTTGASYPETYERLRAAGFADSSFICYAKEGYGRMTAKAIYVYDIDHDGVPELLLANGSEWSEDNLVYELYRLDKHTRRYVLVPHFFSGAFYGWDKRKQCIITGKSNKQQRWLTKNRIANGRLIPVKKCTVTASSGNNCF
ncbi:hypothetical protein [Niabella beijingensis]|uniref:hypothetical protein n=1 Tax=Niabella beijingensis TaxID=2872700 RepID=UPI001CBDAF1E|nr:hypothetical protein [Niabella beijingensis]MBZ4190098.1 hypothetical protein [Niabella beijingensis]